MLVVGKYEDFPYISKVRMSQELEYILWKSLRNSLTILETTNAT